MTDDQIAKLTKLADLLDGMTGSVEWHGEAVGFDMQRPAMGRHESNHPCGAACCIGGWAALMQQGFLGQSSSRALAQWGVPWGDAKAICYPQVAGGGWKATPQQAASLLRHYLATGKVDWQRAMSATPGVTA